MGRSYGEIELDKITEEQVNEFYEFLQGKHMPECLTMKRQPHLSGHMAFRIIYYLQEILEVLPDRFEHCKTCGCIFDSYNEGHELHCDYCRKDGDVS